MYHCSAKGADIGENYFGGVFTDPADEKIYMIISNFENGELKWTTAIDTDTKVTDQAPLEFNYISHLHYSSNRLYGAADSEYSRAVVIMRFVADTDEQLSDYK